MIETSHIAKECNQNARINRGDWQTNFEFAKKICLYLKKMGVAPTVLVEPTCGIGNFVAAAIEVFGTIKKVYGIEIDESHIENAKKRLDVYLKSGKIDFFQLYNENIFDVDLKERLSQDFNENILVLGNPPWVTNSELGKFSGKNIPKKTNFKNVKGIEAITGKGNFDIAENICYRIFEAFAGKSNIQVALLLKNSVVKNIVYQQKRKLFNISKLCQLNFNAKKEFDVSVAASLFTCVIGEKNSFDCELFDFYTREKQYSFGWTDDVFVSNIEDYQDSKIIEGESQLVWRSGVKHDCSKVMELNYVDGKYFNGLGEIVDIEQDSIYPLLKSSDIGKGYRGIRKFLILPQKKITENVDNLRNTRPKTYSYLLSHADFFDSRKSIIYKNKSRFSVFGLGDYSFLPYKVVISSLYKDLQFSLVAPVNNMPVMVDDTCYLLGFDNFSFAKITYCILQSEELKNFIKNICFSDAKRVVSRDLLMRINLYQLSVLTKTVIDVDGKELNDYRTWLSTMFTPSLF